MSVSYAIIKEVKLDTFKGDHRLYLDTMGYTLRRGSPTDYKVKIEGSNVWRRVFYYCVSNSGTLFVKTKKDSFLVVNQYDLEIS
jgi:hypothetical protein